MKVGIMDNRQVRVTAETKDELTAAIVLAMGDQKGVAYGEHNDGLVIFWYIERDTSHCNPPRSKLLYEHTPDQIAELAWNWLEANRDKRRGDYLINGSESEDVWNHNGFQLDQNGWGHAYDPDSDASWRNGSFFLRPVAAWVGK
jgi:hypothetical protein